MFSAFIINDMQFTPTRANADFYMRKNFRHGGEPYYKYLLVYVDKVLVVSHAPEEVMKQIGAEFEIKNNEYGPPTSYLGAGISKVTLNGGSECWSMDSKKYVKAALEVIQGLLAKDGSELRTSKGKHEGGHSPSIIAPNLMPQPTATRNRHHIIGRL
jgi:hypothetical protein